MGKSHEWQPAACLASASAQGSIYLHPETQGTAVPRSIFLDDENSLIFRAISDTEPQLQLSPGSVEGTLTPERLTAIKNIALLARKAAAPAAPIGGLLPAAMHTNLSRIIKA